MHPRAYFLVQYSSLFEGEDRVSCRINIKLRFRKREIKKELPALRFISNIG